MAFEIPTLLDWLESTDATHSWVVPGLIVADGVTLISGPRKLAGKTYMAMALSAAIASGVDFAGIGIGTPGPVLFIEEEGSAPKTKLRWLAVARGMKIPLYALADIHFSFRQRIKLNNHQHRKELMAIIDKIDPVLVVLDSLLYLVDGDENKTDILRDVVDTVQALRARGCAIALLAHLNNGYGYEPSADIDQQVRGAGPVKDIYDGHLALRRYHDREKWIALSVRLRDGDQKEYLARWEFVDDAEGNTESARLIMKPKPDIEDSDGMVTAYASLLEHEKVYDKHTLAREWRLGTKEASHVRATLLEAGAIKEVANGYVLNFLKEI